MSSTKLKLPNNYVEIEKTEMQYVDGGSFVFQEVQQHLL